MSDWQTATVTKVKQASEDMLSISLRPEHWTPHKAGQNYEVRMIMGVETETRTGARLMRKYSIVSPPSRTGELELGVQMLPYGAVSPKMWALKPGDKLEIRGPFGTFTWGPPAEGSEGPIILIGGGSGITPLLSIYEQARQTKPDGEIVFIMSAKHAGRVMHYDKFKDHLVTRFTASDGRIDRAFLKKIIGTYVSDQVTRTRPAAVYVCGPQDFASDTADILLEMGFPDDTIYSEGFS